MRGEGPCGYRPGDGSSPHQGAAAGWWQRLDLERDCRFYFDEAGRLAGVSMLNPREEGLLDLDAYVHPEHTGRGLGGAMLDWLEEESVARGYSFARTTAGSPWPGSVSPSLPSW